MIIKILELYLFNISFSRSGYRPELKYFENSALNYLHTSIQKFDLFLGVKDPVKVNETYTLTNLSVNRFVHEKDQWVA